MLHQSLLAAPNLRRNDHISTDQKHMAIKPDLIHPTLFVVLNSGMTGGVTPVIPQTL